MYLKQIRRIFRQYSPFLPEIGHWMVGGRVRGGTAGDVKIWKKKNHKRQRRRMAEGGNAELSAKSIKGTRQSSRIINKCMRTVANGQASFSSEWAPSSGTGQRPWNLRTPKTIYQKLDNHQTLTQCWVAGISVELSAGSILWKRKKRAVNVQSHGQTAASE